MFISVNSNYIIHFPLMYLFLNILSTILDHSAVFISYFLIFCLLTLILGNINDILVQMLEIFRGLKRKF